MYPTRDRDTDSLMRPGGGVPALSALSQRRVFSRLQGVRSTNGAQTKVKGRRSEMEKEAHETSKQVRASSIATAVMVGIMALMAMVMLAAVTWASWEAVGTMKAMHDTNNRVADMLESFQPLASEESILQMVAIRETASNFAGVVNTTLVDGMQAHTNMTAATAIESMLTTITVTHDAVVLLRDTLSQADALATTANATHVVEQATAAMQDLDAVLRRFNTAMGAMGGTLPPASPAASVGA